MWNSGLGKSQAGIKIARRNINNLRYADDATLMAESEEELKSLLMRMKEESEKMAWNSALKTKIMVCAPIQFSSAAKSYPTFCDHMDCSMPGFPVPHQLPELTQTHDHWVSDAIQPSSSVIPFSSCPQYFPASGSFPMTQFFTSGGQSIGVSTSTSVLPMNT